MMQNVSGQYCHLGTKVPNRSSVGYWKIDRVVELKIKPKLYIPSTRLVLISADPTKYRKFVFVSLMKIWKENKAKI